ncbi:MAG: hypothetical protein A2Z14_10280 [Chloroflexi bacterium RBG_16_48_8]|nr:MAG: hypothetical protein A2Z14_10280 [Chloroflexi bacterium RBG_16_48_8]
MAKHCVRKFGWIEGTFWNCMIQPNRRDFIKGLGIGLASLLMARCIPLKNAGDSPKDHLRDCWLSMEKLAQETQKDYEQADQTKEDLIADHRSALDDLVASGKLSSATADQVHNAFQEATYHVWRSNAPITCYEPMILDYTPTSSGQLAQQVALLSEIADSGDMDENTIAQAQAALERDIAFLSLTNDATQALYEELIATAGETYDFPSFDELELEITPETMQAARFLVELLIEDG